MTLRTTSAADIGGALLFGTAGLAFGYLTPVVGAILVLSLLLVLFDALLGAAGDGPGSRIVRGIGRIAVRAWSPLDPATNAPQRVWLWRAPAIATLGGFILAWGQSLMTGDA